MWGVAYSAFLGGNLAETAPIEGDPLTIFGANLYGWWNADRSGFIKDTGVTENILRWGDISGNSRHFIQATETNKPKFLDNILNNKPVVQFNGVDEFMFSVTNSDWNFLHDGSAHFICYVFRVVPANPNNQTCLYSTRGPGERGISLLYDDRATSGFDERLQMFIDTGVTPIVNVRTGDNAFPTETFDYTFWNSQGDLGGNDLELFVKNISEFTTEPTGAYVGGNSGGPFTVGACSDNTFNSNIELADCFIVDREATAVELFQVASYIATEWAV